MKRLLLIAATLTALVFSGCLPDGGGGGGGGGGDAGGGGSEDAPGGGAGRWSTCSDMCRDCAPDPDDFFVCRDACNAASVTIRTCTFAALDCPMVAACNGVFPDAGRPDAGFSEGEE